MADTDDIKTAEAATRLVLLEQIKKSASNTTVGSTLEKLAYAFALAVGSAPGKLPGGPTNITSSS